MSFVLVLSLHIYKLQLCQVGMLFVRCRGGISHSPEEHVLDDDVWAAGLAILSYLETHVIDTIGHCFQIES